MKPSFIEKYFDGKDEAGLRKAITSKWDDAVVKAHLELLRVPDDAAAILEIGCGIGRLLRELAQRPQTRACYGIDPSAGMIEGAHVYCADLPACSFFHVPGGEGNLPDLPEPVDFAFAWLVFQHVPRVETVWRYVHEAGLRLRPGGTFRCQLLRRDEFPERDLWTYHDPEVIAHGMRTGCYVDVTVEDITPRWTIVSGIREEDLR